MSLILLGTDNRLGFLVAFDGGAGLSGVPLFPLPGMVGNKQFFISTSLFLGNVVGYLFITLFDSVVITD